MRKLLLLLLLLTITITSAQRGTVSGTLQEDNGPLPGANVIIKGTSTGTQTDFDGNYTIECNVGDVLVISFVGFTNQEITVTPEMLGYNSSLYVAPKIAVTTVESLAYREAIQTSKNSLGSIPSLQSSPFMYTKEQGYRSFGHIKDIQIDDTIVRINHFSPEYYISSNYQGDLIVRSISKSSLPTSIINPFTTIASTSHTATTSIFNDYMHTGLAISGNLGKDNYNNSTYRSYGINGNIKTMYPSNLPLKAVITYNKSIDKLANINGFQNLLFAEQLISSSPTSNIIKSSKSKREVASLGTRFQVSKSLNDIFSLSALQTLSFTSNKENYGIESGVFNYDNGYASQKEINKVDVKHSLHIDTNVDISDYIGLTTSTKLKSNYQRIDYDFTEQQITNTLTTSLDINQHILEASTIIDLDYDNFLFLTTGITQLLPSRQENDLFIPQLSLSFIPTAAFYDLQGGFLNYVNLTARYGETVSANGLIYDNYSHNSLDLEIANASSLLNNVDLFFQKNLLLEKGKSVEYAMDTRLFNNRLSLGVTYEDRKNTNGIFPIISGDFFQLTNVANTRTKGFEVEITTTNINGYNDKARWTTGITLSRKRTTVTSLLTENTRIPIAGFTSTNANLIAGESAGIIVGSAFARNGQNNIITDTNGNPQVAENLKIIGDPTPDFNLAISNNLSIGRWKIGLTVDYQNGGDIWNGTQKALDVAIGVDESYIKDASYLNLKSLATSFELINQNKWKESQHKPFFNSFQVGAFAHNLVTTTAFKGASPYSSLYDSNIDRGLNYFNTPLATEVGFNINAKF